MRGNNAATLDDIQYIYGTVVYMMCIYCYITICNGYHIAKMRQLDDRSYGEALE